MEDLVIGDYPEPVTLFIEHVPVPNLVSQPPPLANASGPIMKDQEQTNALLQESQLSSASMSVDDPHHLDLIVSYDVINEEVSIARTSVLCLKTDMFVSHDYSLTKQGQNCLHCRDLMLWRWTTDVTL